MAGKTWKKMSKVLCLALATVLGGMTFTACGVFGDSTSDSSDGSYASSEHSSLQNSSNNAGDSSVDNSNHSSMGETGEVETVRGELYNVIAVSTYPGASNAGQITFKFSDVANADDSTVDLGYSGWTAQDANTTAFKQYVKINGRALGAGAYCQGMDQVNGLSLSFGETLAINDVITIEQNATFTNGDITMITAYKFMLTWDGQYYQASKTMQDGISFLQSKKQLGVGYTEDSMLAQQNATGVRYQSSDPTVATVNEQTGAVTAVAQGEAYIQATATVNGVQKQTRYVVKVQPKAYSSLQGNEECVRFLGRTFTNARGVNCYTTASGIAVNFYGTQLKATITSTGISLPRLCVLVDGETDCTARMVDLSKATSTAEYTLVQGLAEGYHTVYVYKVTEAYMTALAFSALKTDGYLMDSPRQKKYQFEVYGDSITAGLHSMKTSGQSDPSDLAADYMQNGCITYAFKTAQNFNADLHVMARSGIGVYSAWDTPNPFNPSQEMNMQHMWDKSYVSDVDRFGGYENPGWDFSKYTPDLVIVNIGTNDVWHRWEVNTYKTALTTLCNNLFTKYGDNLKIVLVSGMMVTDNTAVMQAVQSSFATAGKAVTHVQLNISPNGHPAKEDHHTASELLTAHIRTVFDM